MSARLRSNDLLSGTYEELASEYYDAQRHPTCANFNEASANVLSGWLDDEPFGDADICEVGPGRSIVAEHLAARGCAFNRLTLVDSSAAMLGYSKPWIERGVRAMLGDAARLPLPPESVDLLVASLGDPYDRPDFWREAQRVVRPGGHVLFTTPSYDWATAYRATNGDGAFDVAIFELVGGRRVAVPSVILPRDEQRALMAHAGFVVQTVAEVPVSAIKATAISPKLLTSRGIHKSIVTAYRSEKRTVAGKA